MVGKRASGQSSDEPGGGREQGVAFRDGEFSQSPVRIKSRLGLIATGTFHKTPGTERATRVFEDGIGGGSRTSISVTADTSELSPRRSKQARSHARTQCGMTLSRCQDLVFPVPTDLVSSLVPFPLPPLYLPWVSSHVPRTKRVSQPHS